MLRFSKTTTGTVLFALDALLILAVWPLGPVAVAAGRACRCSCRRPMRAASPIRCFDLLLLFAMGLYRRDAILRDRAVADPRAAGRRHGRRPGDPGVRLLSRCCCRGRRTPGGRDQAMLFGLAVVTFTFCAFLARLVIDVMVRRHILRRRLLVVGAGQRAWDLLHMLGREGGSLHDDVTLVHDANEQVDPRLLEERPDSILCPPDFNVAAAASEVGADLIIVAPGRTPGHEPASACWSARRPASR